MSHRIPSCLSCSPNLPAGHRLILGPLPAHNKPARAFKSMVNQLLKLDSWAGGPGLPESDFKRLFAKCDCGLVMTRKVFEEHICTVTGVVIAEGGTVLDQLLKLDSWIDRSGLPEFTFMRLFAKCTCGLVMTHRTFEEHVCAVTEDGVTEGSAFTPIDLT